jgi:predicted Zn-dependent peptidase
MTGAARCLSAALVGLCLASSAAGASLDAGQGAGRDEIEVLANGLTLVVEHPAATIDPLLVQALLVVEAGEDYEREAGTARLVPEGLLSARATPTAESLRRRLARLGVLFDVAVGRREVTIRFTMTPEIAPAFLGILASTLALEDVPAAAWNEAIERLRRQEEREIYDPWLQAAGLVEETIWSAAPRGREAVERSPAAAAEELRRRLWVGRRLALAVSGVAPAEIGLAAREALARVPAGSTDLLPAPAPRPVVLSGGQVRCAVLPTASPPVLVMGHAMRLESETDFYAVQVLAHVLGGAHFSRLHRRLRLEEGLTHTVLAEVIPVDRRHLTLRIGCQTADPAAARQIVMEELALLASQGVSAAEAEAGVRLMRSRLLLDTESPLTRLHHRALAALTAEPIRNPAAGHALLSKLDAGTLSEAAGRLLAGGSTVAVVVSTRVEPLCRVGTGGTD